MRQAWAKVFDADDATVNPQYSDKIDARQVYALSLILTSSNGANAGTVKLQGSNDICAFGNMAIPDFTPTNWVDVPTAQVDGSGTVAAGAAVVLSLKNNTYSWIRAVWTPGGGAAGTITGVINSQGF